MLPPRASVVPRAVTFVIGLPRVGGLGHWAWWSPGGRRVMVAFSVVTVAAGVVAGTWRVSG